mmetsp:Transcript_15057/g.22896  ORF Transcript_15057/g.22896 Transcript_15057/m.22896 type:complete len:222 (-) Transcript_15057:366-1031(-)
MVRRAVLFLPQSIESSSSSPSERKSSGVLNSIVEAAGVVAGTGEAGTAKRPLIILGVGGDPTVEFTPGPPAEETVGSAPIWLGPADLLVEGRSGVSGGATSFGRRRFGGGAPPSIVETLDSLRLRKTVLRGSVPLSLKEDTPPADDSLPFPLDIAAAADGASHGRDGAIGSLFSFDLDASKVTAGRSHRKPARDGTPTFSFADKASPPTATSESPRPFLTA